MTPRWYRSLYWRIGVSFVLFLVVVIAAQRLMFGYVVARSGAFVAGASPSATAFRLAAELGQRLDARQPFALDEFVRRSAPADGPPLFVVMRDGRIAGTTTTPLDASVRRTVDALLARRLPDADIEITGPMVAAPVMTRKGLAGLVVIPPPVPLAVARDISRMLSVPGSLLLAIATILAAALVFAPARRRLRALEQAAVRLGAGDVTARAPDEGGDEIARVAHAFNCMADDLSARGAALQRADRQRRQMLADVSHELKTPLTSIRGYVDTLRMPDVLLDPAARARHLDTVDREASRLERLISDLLELARFESSVWPLDVRLFAIHRVFDNVIARHRPHAAERQIALRPAVEPGADHLAADPHRIEQVIDNLVANAIRHTPDGGWVEIEAAMIGARVRLTVRDSGQGIDPEHLPHVFDRFYKVDASRTTAGGSGLGLSIARAIVERHGGTIQVASRPGRSEFSIDLPQPSSSSGRHL